MNKKFIVIGITLVFLVLGLSGCTEQQTIKDDTSRFLGSWRYSEYEYIENLWSFNDNGTIAVSVYYVNLSAYDPPLWINYEIKNNQLCMPTGCYDYEFLDDYRSFKLTSNSGKITIFERL
ncbi:MAG: hypothetical protein QCI00_08275 [Candidatus Thermoplasmatota archaeon]|nr:hypothetical protein [Candidatus Thermoplasmatota archaeon]